MRFVRSLVTVASLVLAVAFLSFTLTGGEVAAGLLDTGSPTLRAALVAAGYDLPPLGAVGETRRPGASPKERWIVALSLLVCAVGIVNAQLMSFGIGLGLAIGVIGVWQVVKSLRKGGVGGAAYKALFDTNKARGDINFWVSIGIYVFSTLSYIGLCLLLVPRFPWLFFVLYGFIYTPIISYITARMVTRPRKRPS